MVRQGVAIDTFNFLFLKCSSPVFDWLNLIVQNSLQLCKKSLGLSSIESL
jgi:hypothetical protein